MILQARQTFAQTISRRVIIRSRTASANEKNKYNALPINDRIIRHFVEGSAEPGLVWSAAEKDGLQA